MKRSLQISGLVTKLVAALLITSGASHAAGLGKLSVLTALGQPLRAEIELLSVQADELGMVEVKLASPDAFRQARIERTETLAGLRFSVDKRANGQPVVRINSVAPVSEPFVDLLIELNWSSGRILREYTVLLDPTTEPMAQAEAILEQVKAPPMTEYSPTTRAQAMPRQTETPPSAPKPPTKAASAAASPSGTYGPVKAGETLQAIAAKVAPANTSLEMMMAALYRANRQAFARDNMNLLKKGQTLSVPDQETLQQSLNTAEAKKLVHDHSVAWHALQGRVADQAARAVEAPAQEKSPGSGKIVQAVPAAKAPAADTGKDVLRLSKGQPVKATQEDPASVKKIQALETDLAARNRSLLEAQSRVSQLEKTVQDLQRLVELKSKDSKGTAKAEPAKPEKEAAKTEPVLPPIEPVAPVEKKPAPKKPPVALPVQEEPGVVAMLLANPLYIGGLVAAILLGGLLWLVAVGNRRRKGLTDFEQSIMSGGDQFKTSIFKTGMAGTSKGGVATQSGVATDFSRLGLGAIDTHEVDPIAEAEVYMAYGRDAQAEEILKEALGKDPSRHEIALKLLEIYATRRDTVTFETQASELYATLGDDTHPTWKKAATMGRGIDPDNPLYRVFEASAPAIPAAAAPAEMPPSAPPVPFQAAVPEPEPEFDLPVEENEIVEFDVPDFSPSAESGPSEAFANIDLSEAPEEVLDDSMSELTMDFDLDSAPSPAIVVPSPVKRVEPKVVVDAPAEPDAFELGVPDLGDFEMPPAFDMTEAAPALDLSAPESNAMDAMDLPDQLDFDVGMTLGDADLPSSLADSFTKPESRATTPGPAEKAPAAADMALPELDFSGIDLEMADVEAAPALEPAVVLADTGMDSPPELDMDMGEETNVKIDLAKAYVEMGDKDGAKEILAEVLKEGNAQQKQQASKMMAELG